VDLIMKDFRKAKKVRAIEAFFEPAARELGIV
jgi:hypothetical protein